MAEVFDAEALGELGFTRRVAIKRMLPDAASDTRAAGRFLDEARIASRLHHGNIVAVLDVGLLDGLPFQVLELVDGIDAAELQRRAGGTLPLDIALAIVLELAHGLDHAHRAVDHEGQLLGIVHRDVKPSNVLVSWAGDVKLADFGIALARDRAARTETGVVAGTLGFIAPEQRTRSQVDGRSDVFALALTLHAFITGYTPLQDITVEMALLEGTPVPTDPALPADVKRVIDRAVAPARGSRPSAAELAVDVGALLVARSTRDTRAVIRAFAAAFATPPRSPARGALDDLLGIEIVPVADAAGDVAQFKTVAAKRVLVEVAEPAASVTSRRRAVFAIAGTVAIVAGGGVLAWRMSGTADDASSRPRRGVTAPLDAAPVIVAVAPEPGDAPILVDAEPAPPPDARLPVRRVTRDARDAQDAALATGWLQVVGGERLVGAQVIVDGGRWKFFVPHKHEVAVGAHRIEVVLPDGTRLPEHRIEVTTSHTVRNAAKLAF